MLPIADATSARGSAGALVQRAEQETRWERRQPHETMVRPESASGFRRSEPGDERSLCGFGETGGDTKDQKDGDRRGGGMCQGEGHHRPREHESARRDSPDRTHPIRKPSSRVRARAPHDVEARPRERNTGNRQATIL